MLSPELGTGRTIGLSSLEAIAFTPDSRKAYVVSAVGYVFASIDTQTRAVTYPATFRPRLPLKAIAVSPDGRRIYAVSASNGTAFAIDPATDTIVRAGGITPDGKTLFVGATPCSIAFTPDGSKVLIANKASGTLSVIDLAGNTPIAQITVGRFPSSVAISPASHWSHKASPNQ